MTFDRIDREALKRAMECGLVHQCIEYTHNGISDVVYKIEFGSHISPDFTSQEITAAIEALLRFSRSHTTTFWLDITTDIVHASLIEGIEKCARFEPNLYVSFKGQASHAPAPPLPERLQNAVQKATSNRRMWHPVLNSPVTANPARSRQ